LPSSETFDVRDTAVSTARVLGKREARKWRVAVAGAMQQCGTPSRHCAATIIRNAGTGVPGTLRASAAAAVRGMPRDPRTSLPALAFGGP